MPATGELIRAMNYVEDITNTLRRISIYIPAMADDERLRLAECLRGGNKAINDALAELEKAAKEVGQGKTIAVIGAGIRGRGIAHAAALGGYRTRAERRRGGEG